MRRARASSGTREPSIQSSSFEPDRLVQGPRPASGDREDDAATSHVWSPPSHAIAAKLVCDHRIHSSTTDFASRRTAIILAAMPVWTNGVTRIIATPRGIARSDGGAFEITHNHAQGRKRAQALEDVDLFVVADGSGEVALYRQRGQSLRVWRRGVGIDAAAIVTKQKGPAPPPPPLPSLRLDVEVRGRAAGNVLLNVRVGPRGPGSSGSAMCGRPFEVTA